MPDNNNFLQNIPIPELGGGFAEQFQLFCEAVKNNFERLISVQYTKGNDGNSVDARHFIIDNDLREESSLSILGYGMVSTIFGDGAFDSHEDSQHDGLNGIYQGPQSKDWILDKLEGTNHPIAPRFGSNHSIPQILDDTNIGFELNLVVDDHSGTAYLAVPYVFIDGRIEDLNNYLRDHGNRDDIYKSFYDFSTVIYGSGTYNVNDPDQDPTKPETWNWRLWRNDLVPKLYFDDNINEFCWQVNGQQTGVTAQGIKGDSGFSPQAIIAKGVKNRNEITVSYIQAINNGGVSGWYPKSGGLSAETTTVGDTNITSLLWSDDLSLEDNIVVRNIDFILVFYSDRSRPDPSTGDPTNFAYLGHPYIAPGSSEVKVVCMADNSDNIFDTIDKQVLRGYLNNIYSSTNYGDLRGMYIPAQPRTMSVNERNNVHMTYIDDVPDSTSSGRSDSWYRLHSAPVSMSQTHTGPESEERPVVPTHTGDWQIDYNVGIQGNEYVQGNLGVGGDIAAQNAYIQGDLTVQGDVTMQGNISVQGQVTALGAPFRSIKNTHLGILSKFKDTRYELSRTVQTTTCEIIYTPSISTTLNIRVGRVAGIQGVYPVGEKSRARGDDNVNRALHQITSYIGNSDAIDGMWYEGNISSKVNNTAKGFSDYVQCYNGPKMYDVVEYNIPINLKYVTHTGVQAVSEKYGNNAYGLQYTTINPNWNWIAAKYIDGAKQLLQGVYQNSGVQANDIFGTPSYRIQNRQNGKNEDYHEYKKEATGPGWEDVECELYGPVTSLEQKFMKFQQNGINYAVQGTLEYINGVDMDYHVDFFTRIFEKPGVQQNDRLDVKTYTTLNVVPVGHISVQDADKTYIVPIHGCLAVQNYLPRTYSSSIFDAN